MGAAPLLDLKSANSSLLSNMRSPTGNELIQGPETLVDKIDTLPTFNIEKIRTILRMSFAVLP